VLQVGKNCIRPSDLRFVSYTKVYQKVSGLSR